MKRTFTLLIMIFPFIGLLLGAEPAPSSRGENLKPMAFVTYVHDPYQENMVEMLVDSIRTWGGKYRDDPIYVVLIGPKASGLRIMDKNVELVSLELEESVRKYPFAAKAYAAAKVEELIAGKIRSLAWFDPETMLWRPPKEMDLRDGISAAVAPVAFINTGQEEGEPVNTYWAAIYKKCALDSKKLFIVETKVDCKKVRAWLNCGMFAVRADRGLCREWAKVLDELLHDDEYQRTAITDSVHKVFLHQAVISTLIVSRLERGEIHMLSSGYNYPLYCHDLDFKVASGTYRMPAHKKAKKLNDLTSAFIESFFLEHPDWIKYVPPVDEPLKKWLTEEVTRVMSASWAGSLQDTNKYDLSKVAAGYGWKVSVYVDGSQEPCLSVERLGVRREGMIGLFTGNGSGGDFSDLKVISTKGAT